MFREGDQECINRLLRQSKNVLDTGIPIRNEPYDRRIALWKEIKANSEHYRNGDCGTFLKDLHTVFLSRFDASLLLLAVAFRQNGEQFEEAGYFSAREIEAYETIERYSYFRILTRNDIAKKIRSRDEKTLALLTEYSVSMKKHMDEILGDPGVRDTIRNHVKKQWDENTKKIGDAIASAGVDLDWFASLPSATKDAAPQSITYNISAEKDAVISIGGGTVVKDAVLTGSSIDSAGGGGTVVKDSVLTRSTITNSGNGSPANSISIRDSVVTSSTIRAEQASSETPHQTAPAGTGAARVVCPSCQKTVIAGARFCSGCGARMPAICRNCGISLSPGDNFCNGCGTKNQ